MSGGYPVDECYDVRLPLVPAILATAALCSLGALALEVTAGAAELMRAGVPHAAPAAPAAAATTVPTPPSPTPAADIAQARATPTPEPTRTDEAAPAPAPADAVAGLRASLVPVQGLVEGPEKAAALLDLMNGARRREGLDPLIRDEALADVARARADNLVANGYFDHYAPDGESAFSELAARAIRYRLAGENLARNNYPDGRTAAAAYEGLMASPGHRANILEPRFARAGVTAVRSGRMWIYVTVFTN